jgi:murein L,D-transpeptidase YafK
LKSRSPVRALVMPAAFAAGLALAGCNSEQMAFVNSSKANKPIPEKLVSEINAKDMDVQSPILVRLFKQEAELEVWKQDRSGRFSLLKTYPICRWSGDLGPKIREGDRQAPEGFYTITPAQMNPNSAYFLSFNTGYPNAFDKALGRTGSELMVHGDCSSRGCYAMTDEQISEIYALGRESFFGGQRAFQLQAYPFRMTAKNLARHRNNPHMPFWKMIKEGSDQFEVSHLEPKVDVCEKRYVFGAQKPANSTSTRPLTFNPTGACPVYEIPEDIADAVREKQRKDEVEVAELVSRGTPTATLRRGIDGGMHSVFAAKLPNGNTGLSDSDSPNYSMAAFQSAPGTIPGTVNPPRTPEQAPAEVAAVPVSKPAPVAAPARVATADSSSASSGGFFGNLAKRMGFGGSETTASTSRPAAAAKGQKAADPKPVPAAPIPTKQAAAKPAQPTVTRSIAQPQPPQLKPSLAPAETAATKPATAPATLSGAQPVVSSSSFDSRWSAVR